MFERVKTILLIFVPIAIGLYVRFDDLKKWLENKELYFFKDRAIFTGNDAFFFARYAEEFFSGKYKAGELDYLRFVPDFIPYWDPVPLISLVAGFFSKIQGTYIENTSLWLVPILSVLFVIPLVLFFKRIGYPIAGFTGAALTVISVAYLPRTSIARLDTDSLNLFFPFTISLFLLLFSKSEGKQKYLYAFLAGLFANLYMWWYTKYSLLLGIVISFLIFMLVERKLKFSKEDLLGIGIFLLVTNPLNLYRGIYGALSNLHAYIFLSGKQSIQGGFPNIQHWVTELKHYDFHKLGQLIVGNEILFGIGLAGILIVLITRWKPMILLLPFLALGLIPLIGAMRFAMYLAPFVGIGIGAYVDLLINFIKKKKEDLPEHIDETYKEEEIKSKEKLAFGISFAFMLAILVVFFYTNKLSFAYVAKPKFPPKLAGDFLLLKEKTEENAWIWSWWSEGYMIEYYGNRGVFVDPGSQFTPKTYFVALAYSQTNPLYAKNVILSVASIGLNGIQQEMKKGVSPEEIKENALAGTYIKNVENPIYWMFTIRSLAAFDHINKIGTWNFKLNDGLSRKYQYIGSCKSLSKTLVACSRWIIDLRQGVAKSVSGGLRLKKVYLKTHKGDIRVGSYNKEGINLVLINSKYGSFGFLMFDQPLKSMFTQMFLLRNYDKEHFELVHDNFPFAVLYKVKK